MSICIEDLGTIAFREADLGSLYLKAANLGELSPLVRSVGGVCLPIPPPPEGLIPWIVSNIALAWLLGFDDLTGSVEFEDSSGNGNDFDIDGAITLEAGTDALFENALESMQITGSAQRASRPSVGTTDENYSIFGIYKCTNATSTLRFYDNILDSGSGTNRPVLFQFSGVLRYQTPFGGVLITGRKMNAVNWSGLFGVTADSAGNYVFYENGIAYSTHTSTAKAIDPSTGGAPRTEAWGEYALAAANPAYGNHYVAGLADETITPENQYELWKRSTPGDLTHDWLERPTLQANCIYHSPLWETATVGGQVLDVSLLENHGTLVGGPTLKQDPLGAGAVYSVALNGSTQYLDLDSHVGEVDYSTQDVTISIRFTATANLDGIFAISSSGTHYLAAFTSGGNVLVRIYDGTVLKTLTLTGGIDGLPHDLCVRWTQSTLELAAWMDGIAATPQIATGLSPNVPTAWNYGRSPSVVGIGQLLGNIELPRGYSAALSDEYCLALTDGTTPAAPLSPVATWRWNANDIDVADGVNISTWAGSGTETQDLTQNVDSDRFTYRATAAGNGLPSAESPNTAKFMVASGWVELAMPMTAVFVLEPKTVGSWGFWLSGTSTPYVTIGEDTSGQDVYAGFNGGPVIKAHAGSLTTDTLFVAVVMDGASSKIYVNELISGVLNIGSGSLSNLKIGGNNSQSLGADAYYHDVMIFDSALDDDEVALLLADAQTDWGVS